MAVPFLVEVLGEPDTYHQAGIRRGTATSNFHAQRDNLLTRMAYGFKKPEHLVALALLDRGGYCPALPGRAVA